MTIYREDVETGLIDFSDLAEPDSPKLQVAHPGEILHEEWLAPLSITPYRLAMDIGVAPNRITEIIHGKRAISAETALRLARYFGTDAQSWLNLQSQYDLQIARRTLGPRLYTEVKARLTEQPHQ